MPRSCSATSIRSISPAARSSSSPDLARQTIERRSRGRSACQRRAGGARHPSRPQRADGGRHPAGLDRPRHRSARLHAAAAGRRRAAACDARWPRELGIRRIVVPRHPGVLSAAGLLVAPDRARGIRRPFRGRSRASTGRRCERALAEPRPGLRQADGARRACRAAHAQILYFADVCYVGQSYHLEMPLRPRCRRPARDALPRLPRGARPHLRPQHRGRRPGSSICAASTAAPSAGRATAADCAGRHARQRAQGARATSSLPERPVHRRPTIYDRAGDGGGLEIRGPAIVEQADTTTLVEPGWRATVVADGTLIITAD